MSDIDELAQIIYGTLNSQYGDFNMPDDAAEAILAAGFHRNRTVTTAEELDALPEGSLVLDRSHDVAEKYLGRLLYRETQNMPLEYLAKYYSPFTVLREGFRDE